MDKLANRLMKIAKDIYGSSGDKLETPDEFLAAIDAIPDNVVRPYNKFDKWREEKTKVYKGFAKYFSEKYAELKQFDKPFDYWVKTNTFQVEKEEKKLKEILAWVREWEKGLRNRLRNLRFDIRRAKNKRGEEYWGDMDNAKVDADTDLVILKAYVNVLNRADDLLADWESWCIDKIDDIEQADKIDPDTYRSIDDEPLDSFDVAMYGDEA